MAPGKIEALLVTDRRSFQYPRIVLGEHEVEWTTIIKYLEVGFYLAQALSGHVCLNAQLRRFKKRDEMCCYSPVDNAEHVLFVCASRNRIEAYTPGRESRAKWAAASVRGEIFFLPWLVRLVG